MFLLQIHVAVVRLDTIIVLLDLSPHVSHNVFVLFCKWLFICFHKDLTQP